MLLINVIWLISRICYKIISSQAVNISMYMDMVKLNMDIQIANACVHR